MQRLGSTNRDNPLCYSHFHGNTHLACDDSAVGTGWVSSSQGLWRIGRVLLAILTMSTALLAESELDVDPPKRCSYCAHWNTPQEPFRIHGNTYYVGVQGLSTLAIVTSEGIILLDGGLPQSAPKIAANLLRIGHSLSEVLFIATSHEHFDHVGGVAALQRATGAAVLASLNAVDSLRNGGPSEQDPQFGMGTELNSFPPVDQSLRSMSDGEQIQLGDVLLTAHTTPGHTPGSLSWSWRSCEGQTCYDIVYADSLNPVSSDGFRFSASKERLTSFRSSIAKIADLPCDIVVSVHPSFTDLFEKKERVGTGSPMPFVDPDGCVSYAADATARLDARLAIEASDPVNTN